MDTRFLDAEEAVAEASASADGAAAGASGRSIDGAAPWDLIVAADVLPYLGDLAGFFEGCASNAAPAALLAFSTETGPHAQAAAPGFAVGPHQRFAHAEAYVTAALDRAGFRPITREPVVVRTEDGAPVPGELVLARFR